MPRWSAECVVFLMIRRPPRSTRSYTLFPDTSASERTGSNNHGDHTHTGEGSTVVDPVCGMQVDPVRTAHHAEHEGITHHFCSARCLERFVADPARYLTRQSDDVPAPTGTMYTCPMHPQVRQDGPGICPLCGMAERKSTVRERAWKYG